MPKQKNSIANNTDKQNGQEAELHKIHPWKTLSRRRKKDFSPYPKRIGLKEKDGVVANHYLNSANSNYKQLGWHTDVAREFALGFKMYTMLNIGIYLTDSNNENGGLRILPGTHRDNKWQTLFRKMQVLNTKDDPNEIEMEAGELCLHDGRL